MNFFLQDSSLSSIIKQIYLETNKPPKDSATYFSSKTKSMVSQSKQTLMLETSNIIESSDTIETRHIIETSDIIETRDMIKTRRIIVTTQLFREEIRPL